MIKYIIVFFLFILSCKSRNNEIKEHVILIDNSKIDDEIEDYLEKLNQHAEVFIDKEKNNLNLYLHYDSSNIHSIKLDSQNIDKVHTFFLDKKSNFIIENLLIWNFNKEFKNIDTVFITSSFKGHIKDFPYYFYDSINRDAIYNKYSNGQLMSTHSKLIEIGYIKMLILDEAYKGITNEENNDIYDCFELPGNDICNFLKSSSKAYKHYPILFEDIMEIYKLLSINSDSIIVDLSFIESNYCE